MGSSPISATRPVGQEVKTPPFHGSNTSSILVRVTKRKPPLRGWFSFDYLHRTELCDKVAEFVIRRSRHSSSSSLNLLTFFVAYRGRNSRKKYILTQNPDTTHHPYEGGFRLIICTEPSYATKSPCS